MARSASRDAIVERFELLASHPEIGCARDDVGPGRRTFPVENYVILYRVRGANVLILRVAHSRRDLDALFRRWRFRCRSRTYRREAAGERDIGRGTGANGCVGASRHAGPPAAA